MLNELIGQGVELLGEQSERSGVRRVLYVLSLLLAVFGLVASLFLWRSPAYPQSQGLLQFIQAGGPAWALLAPLFLGITAVLLLLPLAGRLSLVLLAAVVSMGTGIGALIQLQGSAKSITDLATNLSLVGVFVLVFTTLALAIYDHPALNAPLAAFAMPYWGRLSHLRALRQFGQQHDWQVIGPEGAQNALVVRGTLNPQHLAHITSNRIISLNSSGNFATSLKIAVTSPFDIPGFYSAKKPLDKEQSQGLLGMQVTGTGKRPYFIYVQPYPQFPLTPEMQDRIKQAIVSRQGILPEDAIVQATPVGMRIMYSRNYRRLNVNDGQPQAQLDWLLQLVTLMEMISPQLSPAEILQRQQRYLR